METLRAGIIGLGNIAEKAYSVALHERPDITVEAVCDTDATKAKAWSRAFGAKKYRTGKELFAKSRIDFLMILTPHGQHASLTRQAIKNGIHVYKEKPYAMSMKVARQINAEAQDAEVQVQTAVQRRYHAPYKRFAAAAQKMVNGVMIDARYTTRIEQPFDGWRANPNEVGGCLWDMGYHLVDQLVGSFGLPKWVLAMTMSGASKNEAYADNAANVQFGYANGTTGSFIISRVHAPKSDYVRVVSTEGGAHVERDRCNIFNAQGETTEELVKKYDLAELGAIQLSEFTRAIREGRANSSNPETHLPNIAMIEACYASERLKKPVAPRDFL